ncbi:MAG: hypothetical protein EG823_04865 [Actinobacteria bacterium]|nr:hypothetical protein [Actinomycetota bacterium]
MAEPIIRRQIDSALFPPVARDLSFLMRHARESAGDFAVELRGDYLTVYYQGNIAAAVIFRRPSSRARVFTTPYAVDIGAAFLPKTHLLRHFVENDLGHALVVQGYQRVYADAELVRAILTPAHLEELAAAIRDRAYGPEITAEQGVMAANPPRPEFLLIDRQVSDRKWRSRMDLLALRRNDENCYRFAVLELKVGANSALSGPVLAQLTDYMRHIEKCGAVYARCYETVYAQKRTLGLLPAEMPESLSIDTTRVDGAVVVVGDLSGAAEHLAALRTRDLGVPVLCPEGPLVDTDGEWSADATRRAMNLAGGQRSDVE